MSWWTPSSVSQKEAQASRTASRPCTGGALPKRIVASGERCCAKRSGSIESMSANRSAWSGTAAPVVRSALRRFLARVRPDGPRGTRPIGNRLALPGRAPPWRGLAVNARRREADARQGDDPRDASPHVLRRHRTGGLRLPRPPPRAQERQEDGALRRRDSDLPPLLRQSRR